MPHLNLQISGRPDAALARRVAAKLTQLTHEVLGKKSELTAVTVQFTPHEHWLIDGTPLAESGGNAFDLSITITDETNVKQDKARYIAEAYAALSEIIGKVNEKSYIHVHDVRAASYGYGGRTQEHRYQRAD